MTIKKSFQEMVSFLESNQDKQVSEILEKIYELSEGQERSKCFIKDKDGNVIAIFCYFHKRWEFIHVVEYGSKASNKATLLNTMCKIGVSGWTKTQKHLNELPNAILEMVMGGKLQSDEIEDFKSSRKREIISEIFEEKKLEESEYTSEEEIQNYIDEKFQTLKEELENHYNGDDEPEIIEEDENSEPSGNEEYTEEEMEELRQIAEDEGEDF